MPLLSQSSLAPPNQALFSLPPLPATQVPLEFMVDISPDPHSSDMGSRGRRSVWRAREFFDRELLRGKHPSLRHGEQPSSGTAKALPFSAFEPLDLEAPPADALFFVIEDRGSPPADSQPAGAPAGYPWVGGSVTGGVGQGRGEQASFAAATSVASGVRGEEGASGTDRGSAGSPRCFSGNGRGGGGGDNRGGHQGEVGDYTVPYWAIVRVGESESDPGDDPRSWPMLGSGLSAANGYANGDAEPLRVHRRTYPLDSVGYRIAVIDVKVSLYHPRGSAVAANKDAIMAGLTRVSLRSWGAYRLHSPPGDGYIYIDTCIYIYWCWF